MTRILAVVASTPGGSTDTLVRATVEGAQPTQTQLLHLGQGPYDPPAAKNGLRDADPFDAVVLGTPTYRATYSGVLKAFLDDVPRGKPADGFPSPLRGVPVAVVATGASEHHFLGVDPLISLLVRFFAAWVVPPAVYGVSSRIDEALEDAARLGAATAALSPPATRPQV